MSSITIEISDEVRERVAARALEAGHRSVEEYVRYMIEEDTLDFDVGAPTELTVETQEQVVALLRSRPFEDSIEPGDDFCDQLRDYARGLRATKVEP